MGNVKIDDVFVGAILYFDDPKKDGNCYKVTAINTEKKKVSVIH